MNTPDIRAETDRPLYKLLNPNGTTPQTGFQWPEPGVWLPKLIGPLKACQNGYHVVTLKQALEWAGPELWTVEVKYRPLDAGDKTVVRKVRRLERVPGWNDRNLRLFACDCAERALGRVANPDQRSVNVVTVARKFALGDATTNELDAACDAAWEAACDAAWEAARGAAWGAARGAALDAAWDAARGAAWDAARGAALDAERGWQVERLRYYLFEHDQVQP